MQTKEYMWRGWVVSDRGEWYHPSTARWHAIRYGVALERSTQSDLHKVIGERIKQYPSSGGA